MVENRSDLNCLDVDTIFLDLDDTVWDFSRNSPIALRGIIEKYELVHSQEEYDKLVSIYLEKNSELWKLYHYGKIEKEYLVVERFRYTLEQIGYNGDDIYQFASRLNEEYLSLLAQQPNVVEGVVDLLNYLSQKYPLGILSNGFKGVQQQKLKSGGINQYFDLMVLSEDVGITKPLPGIFEYAAKARNAEPKNILMIGDNYDADICGAHNMGWKTIFFNRKEQEVENCVADAMVTHLKDIINIL